MKQRLGENKTIMITGGHLTPALSVIEQIQIAQPEWEIVFVGRKYAMEGHTNESEEYKVVVDLGIPFVPLTAGRIKRDWSFWTLVSLCKIPIGFIQAMLLVSQKKPAAIVSFGGYIALPVVFAGWLLGIPVVTHEQTSHPGLANRIIANMSKIVCASFPNQEKIFGKPVVLTGLPLRTSVFTPGTRSPVVAPIDKPLLLITGGNTGSVSINTVVYNALPDLLKDFFVIHQVGRLSIHHAKSVSERLDKSFAFRYLPLAYLDAQTYAWALHKAEMVIGRSGANTVMEIAALGKPAIFIPLPWASGNEQYKNAEYVVQNGGAEILPQSMLTAQSLVEAARAMWKGKESYRKKAHVLAPQIKRDGAVAVLHVIEKVVQVT